MTGIPVAYYPDRALSYRAKSCGIRTTRTRFLRGDMEMSSQSDSDMREWTVRSVLNGPSVLFYHYLSEHDVLGNTILHMTSFGLILAILAIFRQVSPVLRCWVPLDLQSFQDEDDVRDLLVILAS